MMMHFKQQVEWTRSVWEESEEIWLCVHDVRYVMVETRSHDNQARIAIKMKAHQHFVYLCPEAHPIDTIQQVIESINLGRVAQPNNL